MNGRQEKRQATRPLRDLYPNLSDEELREVAQNYRRYAALLVRMYTRFQANRSDARYLRSLTDEAGDAMTETPPHDQ